MSTSELSATDRSRADDAISALLAVADPRTTDPIEFSSGQPPFPADLVLWAVGGGRPHSDFLPRDVLDAEIQRILDMGVTLKLDTLEGEFIRPSYWFGRTAAGGRANLIEFLGSNRLRATQATYSSCTPNDLPDGSPGSPDWVLSTSPACCALAARAVRRASSRPHGAPLAMASSASGTASATLAAQPAAQSTRALLASCWRPRSSTTSTAR